LRALRRGHDLGSNPAAGLSKRPRRGLSLREERVMEGLRLRRDAVAGALLALLGMAAARPALAQTYDISWWTVDGGGATALAGAPYEAGVTGGQADAGGPFAGGPYQVAGGFWA